jgi:Sec-independent protein translocase protein TatA
MALLKILGQKLLRLIALSPHLSKHKGGVYLTGVIILIVVVVIGIILFGNTKLGALGKAFYNLFVEDRAKTPEGAKALYSEALAEAKDNYSKANNALQDVAGKTATSRTRLKAMQESLTETERTCERFAEAGDDRNLNLYVKKRQDLLVDIATEKDTLAELEPLLAEAKQINELMEENIHKLEREKTRVLAGLELHGSMKKVYDSMDDLKANSDVQKLLRSAKEGAAEKKEQAQGAKAVHESKMSTQLQRAEQEAGQLEAQNYIAELKAKRAKK